MAGGESSSVNELVTVVLERFPEGEATAPRLEQLGCGSVPTRAIEAEGSVVNL